ncbi:MAG: cytochrome c [Candidatus Poribacteria bacterium]|nr:MAG: cytochrome c [Candidatus Poribacteria bacterium]
MRPLFQPRANTIAKASIVGTAVLILLTVVVLIFVNRTSWATKVGIARQQPVPFSHKHHVAGLGIDCRYCHSQVEQTAFAGMPSTKTCMTCHSQVWTFAELLAPVRESWATERPLQWERVHNLGDYVYFDHSIHVNKGIGCETCHGRVDEMPLVWKEKPLQMGWCLDCHRQPEKYIRPREEVFTMGYVPEEPQEVLGRRLVQEYNVQTYNLEDCSTCHR